MRILSACYRQQGENAVPLLLQQYQYTGVLVFFSCVCIKGARCAEKAGGYMAEQLLQWFRMLDPEKMTRNPEKALERVSKDLIVTIRRIDTELKKEGMTSGKGKVGFAGIFCLGNHYLMLHRGAQRICLINMAFNRVYLQQLYKDGSGGEGMEQGMLQPGIGLLFASEPFYEHISDEMIKECLCAEETATEERMGRRLRELAREGGRKGSEGIGAVYLRTI